MGNAARTHTTPKMATLSNAIRAALTARAIPYTFERSDEPDIEDDEIVISDSISIQVNEYERYAIVSSELPNGIFQMLPARKSAASVVADIRSL